MVQEYVRRRQTKSKIIWKKYRQNMSKEDKQKRKEYIKEYLRKYRKNWFNNLLEKIKENDKLKRVEIDVVNNFIKDDVESFSGVDVGIDDDDDDDDEEEEERDIGFWKKWHSGSYECHSSCPMWVVSFEQLLNWLSLYHEIYNDISRLTPEILSCLLFHCTFLTCLCHLWALWAF